MKSFQTFFNTFKTLKMGKISIEKDNQGSQENFYIHFWLFDFIFPNFIALNIQQSILEKIVGQMFKKLLISKQKIYNLSFRSISCQITTFRCQFYPHKCIKSVRHVLNVRPSRFLRRCYSKILPRMG